MLIWSKIISDHHKQLEQELINLGHRLNDRSFNIFYFDSKIKSIEKLVKIHLELERDFLYPFILKIEKRDELIFEHDRLIKLLSQASSITSSVKKDNLEGFEIHELVNSTLDDILDLIKKEDLLYSDIWINNHDY